MKEVLRKHLSVAKVSKVGHGMVCSEKVQRLSVADETPPQPWLWDA